MEGISKLKKPQVILTVITVVCILAVSIQNYVLSDFGYTTDMVSFYNNYLIFKGSFFHLLANQNLYVLYANEGITDLFKYSPAFALAFGVFSYLPDFVGLLLWNASNALVFYALWKIDWPNNSARVWAWAFVLVEFVTQIQSSQSNGLVAGLLVLGYVYLEKDRIWLATLMIVLSAYIKLFGVVGFALFLLYPNKIKAIYTAIIWTVLLAILPLIVISPEQLIVQYQNWWAMLIQDAPAAYSPSVTGWIESWFGVSANSGLVLVSGIVLFLLPLVQFKKYQEPLFRKLLLSSIMIWVVIFNHKAESPTFVIAIVGVAIWYFSQPKNTLNFVLLSLALVFTQLSPTDLFPPSLRNNYFLPYVVKVVPVILIWIKVLIDSFVLPSSGENESIKASKI